MAQYLGVMDADLVAQEEEELRMQRQRQQQYGYHGDQNVDAMMADAIAQEEQAEVDALVSALEQSGQAQGHGNGSEFDPPQHVSDDDDYDGLFMDLIQQQQAGQGMGLSQDVEMS